MNEELRPLYEKWAAQNRGLISLLTTRHGPTFVSFDIVAALAFAGGYLASEQREPEEPGDLTGLGVRATNLLQYCGINSKAKARAALQAGDLRNVDGLGATTLEEIKEWLK